MEKDGNVTATVFVMLISLTTPDFKCVYGVVDDFAGVLHTVLIRIVSGSVRVHFYGDHL